MLAALGIRAVFAVGGAALVMLAIVGLLTFRPDRSSEPIVTLPEPAGAS